MAFELIIVGDEVLSGRCKDAHLPNLIELLAARGHALHACQIVGDDREELTETIKRSRQSGRNVLITGGIGATPDDHTRQAAAAAFDKPLVAHLKAQEIIRSVIKGGATETQLAMGVLPEGAELIPNVVNHIPGFYLGNHYFMPGFPVMAKPMMEWVLDERCADLRKSQKVEHTLRVHDLYESQMTALLELLERQFSQVKTFSLPAVNLNENWVDIGVKAETQSMADEALVYLEQGLLEQYPDVVYDSSIANAKAQ